MSYYQRDEPFALVRAYWDNEPSVFQSAYQRVNQFGGDPGYDDVWGFLGEEMPGNNSSDTITVLTRVAIQTEMDLAMNGLHKPTKDVPHPAPFLDVWKYDIELLEFIRMGTWPDMAEALPPGQEQFLIRIAENAARRVAKALACCY